MQGIPTTVSVSGVFLKKCMNDPEKAKYLEENLAAIPDCVKSAVVGCQGTLTNLSYQIDANGNISVTISGTNDPDGKIAKENAERKAKEKKEAEEKAEKKWAEQKEKEEKMAEQEQSIGESKETTTKPETKGVIKNVAYQTFLSALQPDNQKLSQQYSGDGKDLRLNLNVSENERKVLNGIWDYYANRR